MEAQYRCAGCGIEQDEDISAAPYTLPGVQGHGTVRPDVRARKVEELGVA